MSGCRELWQYFSERYPLHRYVPLALFLSAGLIYVEPRNPVWARFAEHLVWIWILLFPLRLLDDLYSIEEDRRQAPQRVLCRTGNPGWFHRVLYVSAAVDALLLCAIHNPRSGLLYLLLFLFLHFWYAAAQRYAVLKRIFFVPLIKYPLLVGLLSSVSWYEARLWTCQALLLAVFILYEIAHDPKYATAFPSLKQFPGQKYRSLRYIPFAGAMVWFGLAIFFGH